MGTTGIRREFGPIGNRVMSLLRIVIACAFLAMSLWSIGRVAGLAHDVWRARDWTMVQASVLHISSSATREPRRLGYFTTRIKYRYIYGDRQYEAGRLVFTEKTEETAEVWDGEWLAGIVAFVEDSRREGRPVPIFVNPADPADAVMFRSMVWGNYVIDALVMLLFSLSPIGIARLMLPRWYGATTVKTVQIGIALLYFSIALAGAGFTAAA